MTTEQVANQLVKLCRDGKYEQVYAELYAPDALSIEPEGGTWGTVKGLEAMAKKAQEWQRMVEEMISGEVSDPICADDYFSCTMKSKVRMKGEIVNMDEVCIYRVENGKVVSEQFFYTPLPQFA